MRAARIGIDTFDGRALLSVDGILGRDDADRRERRGPRHALDGVPSVPYATCQQVAWAGETPITATRDGNGYLLMGKGLERILTGDDAREGPARLYLRVDEVVSILGISKSTVLKHIEQGRLRSNRPTDHHRIPVASFWSFLRSAGYDDDQMRDFATVVRAALER